MMTIPLTIKQIEMLVKASESKGLSEAARLLNLSPSAISKGLAALEENLVLLLLSEQPEIFSLLKQENFLLREHQNY